jgi:hypothetical protein
VNTELIKSSGRDPTKVCARTGFCPFLGLNQKDGGESCKSLSTARDLSPCVAGALQFFSQRLRRVDRHVWPNRRQQADNDMKGTHSRQKNEGRAVEMLI